MLEVGKLYVCEQYHLLLYPDKKTAAAAAGALGVVRAQDAQLAAHTARHVAVGAAYWSKKFDKPVNYCNPPTLLLVLSVKEKYVEVLAGDQKGWIINEDWLEIKEIVHEAA